MGLTRRLSRIVSLLALALSGAVLSGCGQSLKQTPFDPAGPVARAQLDLLKLSLWFAIGIGAFVTLALLFVVFRFREKKGDTSIPKQIHGSTKLEIAWTFIPIVILAIVGVPTVSTAFSTKAPKDPNALVVKVVGHQWWWEFQYPDLGIVTANELYIPAHKDVQILLTSDDVIHSFWVPKLAGKMDVIPGRTNKMWFNAEREEMYYGQCAELCGPSHANMRLRVHAVSQTNFDSWVAERKAGAKEPADSVARAGMDLFMGKSPSKANCITCHTVDGTKAQGKTGPNLTNIGSRSSLAAGIVENTDEYLRQWIRDPKSLKPGVTIMPMHPNLTDEELNAIVTYLRGLK